MCWRTSCPRCSTTERLASPLRRHPAGRTLVALEQWTHGALALSHWSGIYRVSRQRAFHPGRRCLLFTRKRTRHHRSRASALGQQRTSQFRAHAVCNVRPSSLIGISSHREQGASSEEVGDVFSYSASPKSSLVADHLGAGSSVAQNGCFGGVPPETAAGLPLVSNWALTTIRRSLILATDVGKRKLG